MTPGSHHPSYSFIITPNPLCSWGFLPSQTPTWMHALRSAAHALAWLTAAGSSIQLQPGFLHLPFSGPWLAPATPLYLSG